MQNADLTETGGTLQIKNVYKRFWKHILKKKKKKL